MPKSDQGGDVEPVGRRLPGQRPKALNVAEFDERPMTLALLQAVRAVVDADPPGWKRGTVARKLGVSESELSKLLRGEKVLKRETVEQLCVLFEVAEPVRQHWLRLHTPAFIEARPRMREWVEKAGAYSDAVAEQRETEQRYQQLETENRRLQADHQDLLGRHQNLVEAHRDTEQKLAEREQAARLDEERHRQDAADQAARLDQETAEHAATRRQRDQARRETERLRAELDQQQADIRLAEQDLQDTRHRLAGVREELADARRERDQARQESARQCDELLTFQAELLILREHDQQRKDEEAVVAQAWQALDAALEQSEPDDPDDPRDADGPVPAAASAVQAAAHSRLSADGTSPPTTTHGRGTRAVPVTSTPAVGSVGAQPVRSPAARTTAVIAFLLAFALVGSGLLVFRLTHQSHSPYGWTLVGVGFFSFVVGLLGLVVYYDDGESYGDSSEWVYFSGQ